MTRPLPRLVSRAPIFGALLLLAASFGTSELHAFNPQPEPPALIAYGPFGLTPAQTLRLNLARMAPRALPGPVEAHVMLVDADGNVVDSSDLRLMPMAAGTFDLDGTELLRDHPELFSDPAAGPGPRAQLRLLVQLHPPDPGLRRAIDPVASNVELIDNATGETVVGWENPLVLRGFNPQPEPPGRF